jgi:hypothetical protein
MKSFLLGVTLCLFAQPGFAACDYTRATADIKLDVESLFGPIPVSKIKVSANPFTSTAMFVDPGNPLKVTHLVYFETGAGEVQGLPIQQNSYIGGYNVEVKTGCRPIFLGAQ